MLRSQRLALNVIAFLLFAVPAGSLVGEAAPPFRDLNGTTLNNALILNGKQLFIDDYLIAETDGVRRVMHQPMKYEKNPVIVPDRAWEKVFNRGSVLYDRDERLFKMWYIVYDDALQNQLLGYATSEDGLRWDKPIVDAEAATNIIPDFKAANPPCVIKDDVDRDPARRYKMLYGEATADPANPYVTSAAFSPDGLRWTPAAENPLIPHSDTLSCPFWDAQRNRYVALLRYGPPNTRIVSRSESEDFIHWSPKVTVLRTSAVDGPFGTQFYGMNVTPYAGVYLGLITAYHGETLQPIPADKLWMDRKNVQLAYSRNGLTWHRIGAEGLIDLHESHSDDEWRQIAEYTVFVPYGEWQDSWDAGVIYPFHAPIVVDDEIYIYYYAHNGRNWWNYHGDAVNHGIGLAKLRLDGFVSLAATGEGTITTKPFAFIGDTLLVNADASAGSIRVEALDADGEVIPGFSTEDSMPIESDAVDHVLAWKDQPHCGALESRPIVLRFHMTNAQIYSIEPRIGHKHLK
ncbi:MAG: hypothetical protein WEB58_23080 [Planctomycetaceae bacterium]